jgi:hypothetical protein
VAPLLVAALSGATEHLVGDQWRRVGTPFARQSRLDVDESPSWGSAGRAELTSSPGQPLGESGQLPLSGRVQVRPHVGLESGGPADLETANHGVLDGGEILEALEHRVPLVGGATTSAWAGNPTASR